jgi:hypothetical protein
MGFTDKCDIFASFHEDGFNRIIRHLQLQRPTLFNYATEYVLAHPALLCEVIKTHAIVLKRGNPIATLEDPLPILGTSYGLNFAAQIVKLEIDFHPGKLFTLPPQLSPPLAKQSFALHLRFCAGLGCPPKEIIDQYVPPPEDPNREPTQPTKPTHPTHGTKDDDRTTSAGSKEPKTIIPIPTRTLLCFCLDVYATGTIKIREYYQKPYLELGVTGLEIVDITPTPMENAIECYLSAVLRLSILPGMRVLLDHAAWDLKDSIDNLKKSVFVKIAPTPAPATVPNNPAIEDDQLNVFANVEVI